MGYRYGGFAPYVPVAERRRRAQKAAAKLLKKGQVMRPIVLEGKTIAKTFWGQAWCENLETYSDFANRLPRGRSYVRNGSIIDLQVATGEITALVSGSSLYKVKINILPVIKTKWASIVAQCSGKIDSLIELLQGKFSKAVMEIITHPVKGLFPHPKEIKLQCSCPDWADMCKHVAAALYGVGVRLDERPEELFILRDASHVELISQAGAKSLLDTAIHQSAPVIGESDLSSLFGIDIGDGSQVKRNNTTKKLPPKKQKTSVHNKTPVKLIRKTVATQKPERKSPHQKKTASKVKVGKVPKSTQSRKAGKA